jgi:hypothetical protein
MLGRLFTDFGVVNLDHPEVGFHSEPEHAVLSPVGLWCPVRLQAMASLVMLVAALVGVTTLFAKSWLHHLR